MKLSKLIKPQVSVEANGKLGKELELVFYGKIVDFKQLANKHSIRQEQWEIRTEKQDDNPYFGSIRVRKEIESNDKNKEETRYTLTIKTLQNDTDAKDEYEVDTDTEAFEQIKRLATGGMIKTRDRVDVDSKEVSGKKLVWEIDVFYDENLFPIKWCKIDLEIPSRDMKVPPFPIDLTDVMDTQPADRTEKQKAWVKKMMDEVFILPNVYSKKKDK